MLISPLAHRGGSAYAHLPLNPARAGALPHSPLQLPARHQLIERGVQLANIVAT
jgi:hypothetical protein